MLTRATACAWIALAGASAGLAGEPLWSDAAPKKASVSHVVVGRSLPEDQFFDATIDGLLAKGRAWQGVELSPLASDERWLRRVTFVLTGLPPTPVEIERFLTDASPGRRERVVDRLLSSPRYGERMAAPWLDAARYADTHGYHADAHRDQWRWRDWAIDAFNSNLPYDRFVLDQVAGDLAEADSPDRRLATGFLRNHMVNFEDGAFAEEYRVEYVADRVHTVAQAFLGTTLSCARCHEHPYDDVTMEDYYAFFAPFNQIDERGLDGEQGNAVPIAAAPTRVQRAAIARLEAALAAVDQERAAREPDFALGQQVWERAAKAKEDFVATPTDAAISLSFEAKSASELTQPTDGSPALSLVGSPLLLPERFGQCLLLNGRSYVETPVAAPSIDRGFSVAAWFQFTGDDAAALWELASGEANTAEASSLRLRLEASPRSGGFRLVASRGETIVAERSWAATIERNAWTHVALRFDGHDAPSPFRLFANGKPLVPTVASLTENEDAADVDAGEKAPPSKELDARSIADAKFSWFRFGGAADLRGLSGMADEARLFARPLSDVEVDAIAGGSGLASLLSVPEAHRTESQRALLADWYRRQVDPAAMELFARHDAVDADLRAEQAAVADAMIAQDVAIPRTTHVLERGRYDSPGEVVQPRGLDFGAFSGDLSRPDRLGLAEWIVRPDNPRTSRVAIERLWRIAFGRGLVDAPEDFGARSEPPLHRELLDSLAVEFVDSGWDVKALLRRMVLSHAFSLSTIADAQSLASDPENRLFARYPARRLDAEMVVDRRSFAGGTLHERVGGRSVFGFDPGDRWKELSYSPGDLSAQLYRRGSGDDLYRRAVYTFWKRASPPVTLSLFDVTTREVCELRREETRTPLQALASLNDPAALDAYRALGVRLADETHRDERDRLGEVLRWTCSRSPSPQELDALASELAEFRRTLSAAPSDVDATLAGGFAPLPPEQRNAERAAWTLVVTLAMNLPEAMEF